MKHGVPSLDRFFTTLYQIGDSVMVIARVTGNTCYHKADIAAENNARHDAST
jgi:hypothetical protein